jgi:hypothetical protein
MRCALVLFSNAAFKGIFRVQVFESAGIDRCAISWFASKPGRNLKTPISRRWTADVEIASAISKPGVFARRHGVPCMFDSLRV